MLVNSERNVNLNRPVFWVHYQVFDIFRARDIGSRETCEYMNICDRPEVFDPPATIQKPTLVSRDARQPIPQNAVKVAFVTDVHVEHRYTVVST